MGMNTQTAKRAFHYKQERVKNVQLGRFRNQATRLLAFVLSVAALLMLLIDVLGRSTSFPIEEIEYRGVFKQASQSEVDSAAKTVLNGNFFTVNLLNIKEGLEVLPWVEEVNLGRKWPATVVVEIKEYEPVMLWAAGGFVAAKGVLIDAPASAYVNIDDFPTLNGEESDIENMMQKFNQWQGDLSALGLSVKKITLSKSNSWEVQLKSADDSLFVLRLGSEEEDLRINRFVQIYAQDEGYFDGVQYVDARYPNGVVVKKTINSVDALAEEA